MTQTASSNGVAPTDLRLPTHAQGLLLFQQVIADLQAAGWWYLRPADTLAFGHSHHREAMTVRHHYDHGTWELWFEKDRYWYPQQTPASVRRALIRLDRPLPTRREVLSQLFGPQSATYAKVPISSDRKPSGQLYHDRKKDA